jgi:outer membrane protein assembly factor BamA
MKITAVEVEGNHLIASDEILTMISAKPGDPIVQSMIQRDIQAVFDMGYFTNVNVDTVFYISSPVIVTTSWLMPVPCCDSLHRCKFAI